MRLSRAEVQEEKIRRAVEDPEKLKENLFRLERLLASEPGLQQIRFPVEEIFMELDELDGGEDFPLEANANLEKQEALLSRILPHFLTPRFVTSCEKKLTRHLKKFRGSSEKFIALSVALFFIEFHKRHTEYAAQNPIWNIIFSLSLNDALETVGGRFRKAEDSRRGKMEDSTPPVIDAAQWNLQRLSTESRSMVTQAVKYLESGDIEIGFPLETVLQGLRAYLNASGKAHETLVSKLLETYSSEIGRNERSDLLWGLSYAMDHADAGKAEAFDILHRSIRMLPVRENPVVFAIYYKCIVEFYRFLKPSEVQFAKEIVNDPGDMRPVLKFAGHLLKELAYNRALKAYEAVSAMDARNPYAELGMGVALWHRGSYREARLHWRKAERYWRNEPAMATLCRELVDLPESSDLPGAIYSYLLIQQTGD